MSDLKNKLEAILFASGKGVSEEDLAKYCDSTPRKIVNQLKILKEEFLKRDGSLVVSKHGGKWKLTVKSKYSEDIQHIASETEFSRPVLKTLAMIAFKNPVLQADIINMRGQGAYDHIKILVKEKFVTKEEKGRTYILKITDKFYNYFDVEGDEEIRDVFEKLQKQQQKITELEIIEIAKAEENAKKKQEEQLLGSLEVVEAKPITNEKTNEEKQKEKNFLERIDQQIEESSERIKSHNLPSRTTENEEVNNKDEEKESDSEENKESESEEKIEDKETKDNKKDHLKDLEKFAEEKSKNDKEDFI